MTRVIFCLTIKSFPDILAFPDILQTFQLVGTGNPVQDINVHVQTSAMYKRQQYVKQKQLQSNQLGIMIQSDLEFLRLWRNVTQDFLTVLVLALLLELIVLVLRLDNLGTNSSRWQQVLANRVKEKHITSSENACQWLWRLEIC